MKIYLGFSKRKSFNLISKLIQLVEGIPFSHVYVRFYSEKYERDIIYEASGTSVHFKARWLFDEANVVVREYEIDIGEEAYKKTMQFCLDRAGLPYGTKSLIGFLWVYLGKILGKKWPNPFRDGGKTYVCSEIGAAILESLGYKSPTEDDAMPKELDKFLQELSAISDSVTTQNY